jgi:hypothetical protein
MLGLWLPSPSGHLGSSEPAGTMRGRGRQARPAAAAQAASTREKFVKGDRERERKARRAHQLPPRCAILSSGGPIEAISHFNLLAPLRFCKVGLGGVEAVGIGAGSSAARKRAWHLASPSSGREQRNRPCSPHCLRPWAWVAGN